MDHKLLSGFFFFGLAQTCSTCTGQKGVRQVNNGGYSCYRVNNNNIKRVANPKETKVMTKSEVNGKRTKVIYIFLDEQGSICKVADGEEGEEGGQRSISGRGK